MKCLVEKYKECKDWNQKQSGGSIWKSLHYDEVDANTSSSSVESEKESRRMRKKRKTPQTPDTENETEKVMKKWKKCKRLRQNNGYDDQIYGGHA